MRPECDPPEAVPGLLPPASGSYQASLVRVTRYGAITAATFIAAFVLLYGASGFPGPVVWINLAALLTDLVGLGLVSHFHIHKPAAHLVTFATYLSLLGSALLTGGIDASSLVWLVFVPVAATIMAGTGAGVLWGAISLGSLASVYVLNRVLGIDLTLLPSQSLDRLIDLAAVTLATTTAIWLNERAKARALNHLELAQAQLRHLATVDPLTNVFNRRYFFDQAQRELDHARAGDRRTSVILLDIDHFKEINDAYGHGVGDQILIGVVALCQDNLRRTDLLARLGGEEFVILLPETDLAEAQHTAERLRAVLEQTPIATDAGTLEVTISVGVASQPGPEVLVPVHQLVQGADQAMYRAKHAGRNRVATWQAPEQI